MKRTEERDEEVKLRKGKGEKNITEEERDER